MTGYLKTFTNREDGIFSTFEINDKKFYVIEHAFQVPISMTLGSKPMFRSLLPSGIYQCKIYASPTHGKVYLLQDVPGHDYIEIHIGNYNSNSKMCLCIGEGYHVDADNRAMVTNSKIAFEEFMHMMNEQEFTLVVDR